MSNLRSYHYPRHAALRRAEDATWGERPGGFVPERIQAPRAKIKAFTPFRNPAGTMAGYLSAQLPSGMIVNDAKLMIGPNGAYWIAMPSQKQLDRDGNPVLDEKGKPRYRQFIDFADGKTRDRFCAMLLDALRAERPDVFETEGRA